MSNDSFIHSVNIQLVYYFHFGPIFHLFFPSYTNAAHIQCACEWNFADETRDDSELDTLEATSENGAFSLLLSWTWNSFRRIRAFVLNGREQIKKSCHAKWNCGKVSLWFTHDSGFFVKKIIAEDQLFKKFLVWILEKSWKVTWKKKEIIQLFTKQFSVEKWN